MTSTPMFPAPALANDPGFACALQVDTVAQLVQRHLAADATLLALVPDYVRWKDDDGSLVGYRATTRSAGAEHATYVTVRTAPVHRLATEAERLLHRADENHAGLRAFAFLPAEHALLLSFPIDRAMHDLRRLVRASKVRSLVAATCPEQVPAGLRLSKSRSSCQLVRYKPERRAVLRWRISFVDDSGRAAGHRLLWIRCHADAQATRTRLATDAAANGGVVCPRTLGVHHDRLLVESHVDGDTWSPFAGDAPGKAAALAGAVVARLHAGAIERELPVHGTLAELDRALRAAEDLARLDPDLGRLAAELTERLASELPPTSPCVLAHGDLHPGQVLLTAAGASLCDFDRACLAPPAHDLATMVAHCIELDAARARSVTAPFLHAYGQRRQLPLDLELRWWTSCVLVRNAMRAFRSLRADWPAVTATTLRHARQVLDRFDLEAS